MLPVKHTVKQQFQSALAGALWGYKQSGSSPSALLRNWCELGIPQTEMTDSLQKQAVTTPLRFIVTLLPLLLIYSDDSLRRWLRRIGDETAATAVAVEGTIALRRLVEAAIAEKPLTLAIALPSEPQSSFLFPYLSTALAYEGSGAGAIQVHYALESVGEDSSSESAAAQAAIALALALFSALRTPDFPELACKSLLPLIPLEVASDAAAIAAYLSSLTQDLSAVSLERYQTLSAPLLAANYAHISPATVDKLSQQLFAIWSGAIPAQVGAAAIAMPSPW